jgi:hypothetical protein
MDQQTLRRILRAQIYPITQGLCVGPYAGRTRLDDLLDAGVTHVLNLSESESILRPSDGLREVAWMPVVDLEVIPDDVARACLDRLHRFLCEPDARVYVHCIAGRNRSPTLLWLYLVACGVAPDEAARAIGRRALNAVPGHPRLVSRRLLSVVRAHGGAWLPHPRPQALEWAPELAS